MDNIVEIILTALPFLEGLVSQATVLITAIPLFIGELVGLPIWLYGVIGAVSLYLANACLCGEF